MGLQQTIQRLRLVTGKDPIPLQRMAFWPYKYDKSIDQTEFTSVAVLFAVLEDTGWPRRVVWTFLRDEVEKKICGAGNKRRPKGPIYTRDAENQQS